MCKLNVRIATCGMALALLPASALAQQKIASTATSTSTGATAGVDPSEAPKTFEIEPRVEYDEPDRVLLPGAVKHGGYGGPQVKFTTMTGDPAILVGGQGGWIINHGFVIGGAGYGLATMHDAPQGLSPANLRSTLQFGYGGPRLGYIMRPHEVVHVTLGLLVGGGGYTIFTRDAAGDNGYTHDGRGFFVMEPEAELETNVLRFLRVGFAVSYRYVGTRSVPYLGTSDLSGPSASVVVKAGAF